MSFIIRSILLIKEKAFSLDFI